MSLIDDALRRIQDPIVKKQTQASQGSAPAKPAASPAQPAAVHSWSTTPSAPSLPSPVTPQPGQQPLILTTIACAILGLSAVLLIGGALWLKRSPAPIRDSMVSPDALVRPDDQQQASQVPQPSGSGHAPGTALFVLSGIVEGAGEPYAVINGTILGLGETIAGATLIEIDHGTVRLRHADGREIVLRSSR